MVGLIGTKPALKQAESRLLTLRVLSPNTSYKIMVGIMVGIKVLIRSQQKVMPLRKHKNCMKIFG
jgi:hypothetical protein